MRLSTSCALSVAFCSTRTLLLAITVAERTPKYCSAGDHAQADGAHRDADRIEQTADRAADDGRTEGGPHDVVFAGLPPMRLVRLDALVAA